METLLDCDVLEDDETDFGAAVHSAAPPPPSPAGRPFFKLTLVSLTVAALAGAAFTVQHRIAGQNQRAAAARLEAASVPPTVAPLQSMAPTTDDSATNALAAKAKAEHEKSKAQAKAEHEKSKAQAKAKPNNKPQAKAKAKTPKRVQKAAAKPPAKKRGAT